MREKVFEVLRNLTHKENYFYDAEFTRNTIIAKGYWGVEYYYSLEDHQVEIAFLGDVVFWESVLRDVYRTLDTFKEITSILD